MNCYSTYNRTDNKPDNSIFLTLSKYNNDVDNSTSNKIRYFDFLNKAPRKSYSRQNRNDERI